MGKLRLCFYFHGSNYFVKAFLRRVNTYSCSASDIARSALIFAVPTWC